jgi:hypothetical protein
MNPTIRAVYLLSSLFFIFFVIKLVRENNAEKSTGDPLHSTRKKYKKKLINRNIFILFFFKGLFREEFTRPYSHYFFVFVVVVVSKRETSSASAARVIGVARRGGRDRNNLSI